MFLTFINAFDILKVYVVHNVLLSDTNVYCFFWKNAGLLVCYELGTSIGVEGATVPGKLQVLCSILEGRLEHLCSVNKLS